MPREKEGIVEYNYYPGLGRVEIEGTLFDESKVNPNELTEISVESGAGSVILIESGDINHDYSADLSGGSEYDIDSEVKTKSVSYPLDFNDSLGVSSFSRSDRSVRKVIDISTQVENCSQLSVGIQVEIGNSIEFANSDHSYVQEGDDSRYIDQTKSMEEKLNQVEDGDFIKFTPNEPKPKNQIVPKAASNFRDAKQHCRCLIQ